MPGEKRGESRFKEEEVECTWTEDARTDRSQYGNRALSTHLAFDHVQSIKGFCFALRWIPGFVQASEMASNPNREIARSRPSLTRPFKIQKSQDILPTDPAVRGKEVPIPASPPIVRRQSSDSCSPAAAGTVDFRRGLWVDEIETAVATYSGRLPCHRSPSQVRPFAVLPSLGTVDRHALMRDFAAEPVAVGAEIARDGVVGAVDAWATARDLAEG